MNRINLSYAWSSTERALSFAERLAKIVVPTHNDDLAAYADSARLIEVLRVLKEFSPIVLATLWKLKSRAEIASVIGRTDDSGGETDPLNVDDLTEFVCGFSDAHLRSIIEGYSRKRTNQKNSRGVFVIPDLSDISCDGNFFPPAKLAKTGARSGIFIPFGAVCSPVSGVSLHPNFLLNLYFNKKMSDREDEKIPREILAAIESKLTSGVCALIDRRLTRITRSLSKVKTVEADWDRFEAISETLSRVVPQAIACDTIILVYTAEWGAPVARICWSRDNRFRIGALGQDLTDCLVRLVDKNSERNPPHSFSDPRRVHARIAMPSDIASESKITVELGCHSAIVGEIASRAELGARHGHVLLINRLNDFALAKNPKARILDAFDWEDEIYLSHICSILDFVAELFVGQAAKTVQMESLMHELKMASEFSYESVERVRDSLIAPKSMPVPQQIKELNDALAANDYETALLAGYKLGNDSTLKPPTERYSPAITSIREVADEVALLCLPYCRRHRVDQGAIRMRNFPRAVIDRSAIRQVFLNIVSNAIKYSGDKPTFRLNATSEEASIAELVSVGAPPDFLEQLASMQVKLGWLFTFEDNGIGVPQDFIPELFKRRQRARRENEDNNGIEGSGLGLWITRRILRDHFSEIWLQQALAPTIFSFFIPDFVVSGAYLKEPAWLGKL